jgi:hypothetical protein
MAVSRTRAAVARRFLLLRGRLQPSNNEREKFARHRVTVAKQLVTVLGIKALVPMGSYTRDTAIARYSGVDPEFERTS